MTENQYTAFVSEQESGSALLPISIIDDVDMEPDNPLTFKVSTDDKMTHVGVLEFHHDDSTVIYLPRWCMTTLNIKDGDRVKLELTPNLPKVTRIVVKPKFNCFHTQDDPLSTMQDFFDNHFRAITVGDQYVSNEHMFKVIEIEAIDELQETPQPVNAGSVFQTEPELQIEQSEEFDEWEESFYQRQLTLLAEMETRELTEAQQAVEMKKMEEEAKLAERFRGVGQQLDSDESNRNNLMYQLHLDRQNRRER